MRKLYSLLTIIACLALFSCEEVIPLDLKSGTPKLVVEAALTWKKGTTGNVQKIKNIAGFNLHIIFIETLKLMLTMTFLIAVIIV